MLKEIFETKPALKKLIRVYLSLQVTKIFETIANFHFESFCLVGCGTAYHAALMGAMMIEKIARIPCSSAIASEFIYSSPILSKKTLYIFVSQSGETADTIRALELVKSAGCQTLALTNVLYSTLSKLANFVLPVCAGREVSVASTKAYTCQISILYLLANYLYFGEKALIEAASKICNLSDIILDFDKKKIELLADQLMPLNEAIFIGKGLDYVTSLEASLKLKEISYINSSSYPSGELKHGFLALVTTKTPLIAINTQKNVSPKTINSASEAASRGANVFLVGISDNFNNYLALPALEDENLLPIVSIVPLQYLAYLVSIKRGINPDKPRNLAKSVTVE